MSTRSGKRIHSSLHENIIQVDVENAAKSERKTRSKHVKENVEDIASVFKAKKRNNYVSFPSDDEGGADEVNHNEDEGKATRTLRKNALKERNTIHTTETIEPPPDNPKAVRSTRSTRKITENTEELQEVPQPESKKNERQKVKKSKKKKKSDSHVTEDGAKKIKKKKKKGRRSSSMIVEDIEPEVKKNLNKSNTSVDSFHSAAGSPQQLEVIDDIQTVSSTPPDHAHNKDNQEKTGRKTRSGKTTNNEQEVVTRKRKASGITKDTTFDTSISLKDNKRHKHNISNIQKDTDKSFDKETQKNGTKEDTDSQINTTYEKDDFNMLNNSRRSTMKSKHNGTFDNIENTAEPSRKSIINTTYDRDSDKRLSVKDSTFDKDTTLDKNNAFDKRKSIKDTTFEKDTGNRKSIKDTTFDKNGTFDKDLNSTFDKRKSIKDTTFDKNTTFDKDNVFHKRKSIKDTTFEKDTVNKKSIKDTTFEKNTTFEKDNTFDKQKSIKNSTFDKDTAVENLVKDATFDKDSILKNSLKLKDTTFDKDLIDNGKSVINTTFEKEASIQSNTKKSTEKPHSTEKNSTFDKNSKSSLISSDNSNITLDKSEISRISITSDDSKENIINTTPVLIESSFDISQISEKSPTIAKTPDITVKSPVTPLKREGTFTKDEPAPHLSDVLSRPQVVLKTPTKSLSLPSPGCTPFPTKSSQERVMNITRSIEKRRSSIVDAAPRATKVMFCSPMNNPAVVAQQRRKVIKSNLKGSNKSFVFDDSVVEPRPARKRSYTQSDAEDVKTKRKRVAVDSLHTSVDRSSRSRTCSASAKLTLTTPSKKSTPSKAKITRTKLPNFAALHQKQFEKMESLDECQERKAKRAKQLLTPTGSATMLERISPKETEEQPNNPTPATKKPETPIKSLPTLKSINPGYTRFGFRLNLDVNPFTFTTKTDAVKSKEKRPTGLTRQATAPSMAGATSQRKEEAKKAIMREKTLNVKRNVNRNENRTIIKGVRTNRRFELQMRMRNIE